MKGHQSRLAAGFTLIELMIVVAIIGILASIAIPSMQRSQYRAKVAERGTLMEALARGINDTVAANQGMPDPADRSKWVGPVNPAWDPGASTTKRPFTYSAGGWKFMPVIVQGSCYYSYSFQADEQTASGPASMWIMAEGDLDGDGASTTKQLFFTSAGYSFFKDPANPEYPEPGAEDDVTFHTF